MSSSPEAIDGNCNQRVFHDVLRKELGDASFRVSLIESGTAFSNWGFNVPAQTMQARHDQVQALAPEDAAHALVDAFAQPRRVNAQESCLYRPGKPDSERMLLHQNAESPPLLTKAAPLGLEGIFSYLGKGLIEVFSPIPAPLPALLHVSGRYLFHVQNMNAWPQPLAPTNATPVSAAAILITTSIGITCLRAR